ncbi:PREDICTED: myosuppressin-like [Nicrophorus vespilloides]|uniref:Myosuppressin-like n=1 Tax=Nicrophorus vespilloides TaxID=110193 RepID=A0ABM1MGM8_NICVS|nr:PREDICTED: myosuppressin-like [Nicrophorus vespilloides]
MNQCTVYAVAFIFVAMMASSNLSMASNLPLIYCQPSALDGLQKRQLCFALLERMDAPQEVSNDVMDNQLYERGIKRQDVDHVFLRFGRRMGL